MDQGDHFGLIDLVGCSQLNNFEIDNFLANRNKLQRQFTVQAITDIEILTLSIQDLARMKEEFYDCYQILISQAYRRLKRVWILKLKTMKSCTEQLKIFNKKQRRRSISTGAPPPSFLQYKRTNREEYFKQSAILFK